MQQDLVLKTEQATWETPKNIAILAGAVAAISGALGGFIGFKAGSTPPALIIIQVPTPTPSHTH